MAWYVNTDEPGPLEPYDWHTSNQDDQGMIETRNPGDFKYRTQNASLVPSAIQPKSDQLWVINNTPEGTSGGWYQYGEIITPAPIRPMWYVNNTPSSGGWYVYGGATDGG